jgi:hypothetical protein
MLAMRALTSIDTACAVLWIAGCARHVQLKFPESEIGDAYICYKTTESTSNCHRADKIDPSDQNRRGTSFVILPTECQGHFNQITIQDANSSNPTVHVICAPLENVVQ